MRFLLVSFLAVLLASCCFSQQHTRQRLSILEVQFSLSDFKANTPFAKPGDMSGGLHLGYTKSMNDHFDWRISLNGTYADSIMKGVRFQNDKSLLLEADFAIRGRMFAQGSSFQPYLLGGLGVSKYGSYYGAYLPAGIGLQVSIFRDVYILTNAQYRVGLTSTLNSHYFYSFGLAGTIGGNSKPQLPAKPLPVPVIPPSAKDRDGDGIVDSADACPDEPGLAIFKGCADTDQDGIANKDDKCPTVYGVVRYQGCPVPDTDKDGINDEEDQCINVPGLARYKGCPIPDRDKDGVNDEQDKCIDVPGVKENAGCPMVDKGLQAQIDLAAKNIYFSTGSAKLLSRSFKALDEVVSILCANPSLHLQITGHTDNTGTPQANQKLSRDRAASVLQYIQNAGIGQGRLSAQGFGQEQPVASNNTPEGRAANRRVELKLVY
jgi:OmpA-OmpF porin, OOP family